MCALSRIHHTLEFTMTVGTSVGSFIGSSAAYAAHAAVRGAEMTGRFGADVVAGTQAGYSVKSAELAARRAGAAQARLAALEAAGYAGITPPAAEPCVAAEDLQAMVAAAVALAVPAKRTRAKA